MKTEIRNALIRTIIIISSVICIGTVGYLILDNQWTVIEAFYMTIISITTVGYGEVYPLSDGQRIFTSILIVLGIGTAATAFTRIGSVFLESKLDKILGKRKMDKKIKLLKDHYIICGYNEISAAITSELDRACIEFVVIDDSEENIIKAETRGYLTIKGEVSGDTVLITAGVKTAKGLVICSEEFVTNLVVSMAARELNPSIYIISQGSDSSYEERLRRAGANEVSYPLKRGGQHIAKLIIDQSEVAENSDFEYTDMDILGYRLKSYSYYTSSRDSKKETISDLVSRTRALNVLAIKHSDGTQVDNPDLNIILNNGDKLALVVRQNIPDINDMGVDINWSDDLSVGISSIDEEHKLLLYQISRINQAVTNSISRIEIADIFDNLIDYTEKHFSHEEKLFKEYNYPGIIEHTQEHRELTGQLRALNRDRNSILPENINEFLLNWVKSHIKECDMEYVNFFKEFNID